MERARQMTSGHIAKLRLEQTLASDFLECGEIRFDPLCQEIRQILSRYMNMNDTDEIQLRITRKIRQEGSYVKTIQIKGL